MGAMSEESDLFRPDNARKRREEFERDVLPGIEAKKDERGTSDCIDDRESI
jgi:hypothetical protein